MLIFDALNTRAKAASGTPRGYESARVNSRIRIDASGNYLGFDAFDKPMVVLLPKMDRGSSIKPNTAIDNALYMIGAGGKGREAEWVSLRHEAFIEVLGRIDHPAARAVLLFRADPNSPLLLPTGAVLTPEQVAVLEATPPGDEEMPLALTKRGVLSEDPKVVASYAALVRNARAMHPDPTTDEVVTLPVESTERILIDVEGYPEWWLAPEVQTVHRDRLAAFNRGEGIAKKVSGNPIGTCSVCLGEGLNIARTFPKSSKLGGTLVSHNAAAWSSYKREQGFNSPTCEDCANGIAVGIDSLAASKGTMRSTEAGIDLFMFWWTDNAVDEPWLVLDEILNHDTDPDRREELLRVLDAMPDGHFVSLEKLQTRLMLRRYTRTSSADIARRVRRWLKEGCGVVWSMAGALAHAGARTGTASAPVGNNDLDHTLWTERLYMNLIADQPIMPRETRPIERALVSKPFAASIETVADAKGEFHLPQGVTFVDLRRKQFLIYLNKTSGLGVKEYDEMTLNEQFGYALGKLFARTDWLQTRRSNPQKSFQHTHYRAAVVNPRFTYDLCCRTNMVKGQKGNDKKTYADGVLTALTNEVGDLIGKNGGQLPRVFSLADRIQFHRGFSDQRNADEKAKKEAIRLRNDAAAQSAPEAGAPAK